MAPGYRTPLPGLLAAGLETAINRVLALDENSGDRLRRLDNCLLRLDLEGVGISLFFAFTGRRVDVGTNSQHEPDAIISGSPLALFSMAAPEDAARWGSVESRVRITGDAQLARDLERLFSQLDPDWEGRLSRMLGDVVGHQVAAGLRGGVEQFRQMAGNAADMFSEYFRSNQGPTAQGVAQGDDLEEFADSVDEIRTDTDRLEGRVRKLTEGDE